MCNAEDTASCNAEDTASCNAIERCCVECRCDLDESTRSDSTYWGCR